MIFFQRRGETGSAFDLERLIDPQYVLVSICIAISNVPLWKKNRQNIKTGHAE
jgi:hypothetical protein